MAFFNLTQLGPQNPFHSASQKSTPTSCPASVTDTARSKPVNTLPGTVGPSYTKPLPSFTNQMYGEESTRHVQERPHGGSYSKFSEMRIKHQRNEKGPTEEYQQPVAMSHNYGWWIKECGHAPQWAQCDRHAHVNSEMTRYVDEMSLTNKDFSLF